MSKEEFFTTVLVVEDEPLVCQQLCQVARTMGYYDVRHAGTIEEAQEVLNRTAVGVLIADIGLPDGDGRKLAADALRQNPGLVLVLVSGYPAQSLMLSQELRERAHLLEKPFDLHDLSALLNACACEGHGSSWRR